MSPITGRFVWYELATGDARAAETFYKHVIGWTTHAGEPGGPPYIHLSAGQDMVGGLYAKADFGVQGPGGWMGYIGVEDVDASAIQVVENGGTILRQPADLPGVGRFALAADPHGAVFTLFKGSGEEGPAKAGSGAPGHVGWHELYAGNGEEAFAFYSKLFGWTKGEAMDMGPMGVYQLFATGGGPVGGIMTRPPEMPSPAWLYYFNVEALDAALARVEAGGGRRLMGPQEVPGGGWIAQCLDPQGGMFAMLAPRR